MSKIIILVIFISTFIAGCSQQGGPYTSITSSIVVIEKDYSEDYKVSWVIAYDPNNSARDNAIKIVVDEPMVWNLIEKETEYFVSYDKNGDNTWVLQQIEQLGDDRTLR
jgi:hypothetical protein